MPELVTYLSLDPADYITAKRVCQPAGTVHLRCRQRLRPQGRGADAGLLATAFPYESFVALGTMRATYAAGEVLESGTLSEAEIHRLYANARIVVFPSFYEGFGFPVLTTLAYGERWSRVNRHSRRNRRRCVPHGRIVPYARRDELVDVVGRILHGEAVDTVAARNCARQGTAAVMARRRSPTSRVPDRSVRAILSRSHSRSREHAIAQLMAAPISLVDAGLTAPLLHSDVSAV